MDFALSFAKLRFDSMKIYKHIFVFLSVLLLFTGCGKTLQKKIVGEWHSEPMENVSIYAAFASDSSFELFQKVGDGRYRRYSGTYILDKRSSTVNGTYSDGSSWATDYEVQYDKNSDRMYFIPADGSGEGWEFVRKSIPSEVRDGSILPVKSSEAYDKVLWLL